MVAPISPYWQDHIVNGGFIPCKHIHEHSCEYIAIEKLFVVFFKAFKFYGPIHLLPLILFKRKQLKKE